MWSSTTSSVRRLFFRAICATALPVSVAFSAPQQGNPSTKWTAETSDPVKLGWMKGAPPASDKVIRGTDADFFSFPKLRWTVCHFQQLMPSTEIRRGVNVTSVLPRRLDPMIDELTFQPLGSNELMTWEDSLSANFTDGIIVLHNGVIVYENYAGCLNKGNKHAAMSVTKSFVGLIAEILIAEGSLDENRKVAEIIPELRQSAFGDASVRQVMDMTTSFRYSEDYSNPNADVWTYSAAGSPFPKPSGFKGPQTYYEFLKTIDGDGRHGGEFAYKTPNTDVLGWVVVRTAGKTFSDLMSDKIWTKLGMDQSAFITVDSVGTPFVGGGLSCGLRDLARVGQLLLDEGRFRGKQVIPRSVTNSIRSGGSKTAFSKAGYKTLKGASYRSMWWVLHDKYGSYAARGVHGQTIYVAPGANMVIARFASHPEAKNAAIDPTSLPAYRAVADYLAEKH